MRQRLRELTAGVAIYGAGDAAVSVISFLLLPIYIRYLTPTDYGALLILISIETFAKIINRWGLDGAFMRYYLDREPEGALQRLTSTILIFMLLVDGLMLAGALAVSTPVTIALFGSARYLPAFRLMLVNTFVVAFTFVPFHVMRMRREARSYSAFTFARSSGTLVLRLVFVIGAGLGVAGLYLADLAMTAILVPLLWRWCAPLLRLEFDARELGTALRFGLPRLPHGLAQQAFDYGNRLLLSRFVPLAEAGVYQNAATLGTGVKFFLSSFETAWAPFYYATAREADARTVLSKMTTYALAVLVLLVAGTAAVAHDLVLVMLNARYLQAVPIVPIVGLALGFQGIYLLTSIGLNLTGRTYYYPVATFAAAVVGLGSGFLLMPRIGAMGAALSLLASFITQAAVAFGFSRRFYSIPYETGRMARIVIAGALAVLVVRWVVPALHPVVGLLVRGALTVATYGAVLWLSGFFRQTERAFLSQLRTRFRERVRPTTGATV